MIAEADPHAEVDAAPAADGRGSVAAVSITGLSKTFAGTQALRDVDLQVGAGEVHAVLGENGSGKSTLIKVLAGYHRPDAGCEIRLAGEALDPGSAEATYRLGCRIVHQDLGLVAESSVLDNLSFSSGFPTRLGTIRGAAAVRAAAEDLARVGLDIDPRRKVGDFTAAVKTGIAVARALRPDPVAPVRLLVLDEPTATLPDDEVSRLLDIVRRVAAEGIGVIYVTHRLDEVFAVADTVTVLRDGEVVDTVPTGELDRARLIDLLLGEEVEAAQEATERMAERTAEQVEGAAPDAVLRVRELRSETLHGIDLQVRPGEILGVAGITGSGRESLLATVYGSAPSTTGEVEVAGRIVGTGRPHLARRAGVAYLPPDRKIAGGFMDLDARENVMVSRLRGFTTWGQISTRRERHEVTTWMDRFDVAPAGSARRKLATFSGGNQQKILFGKWLRLEPRLFLLDEPTQGVDVGAKALLHHALVEAAGAGMAIVISSTDVDELASICSVVVVLRQGRVVRTLTGHDITTSAISRAVIGSTEGVPA